MERAWLAPRTSGHWIWDEASPNASRLHPAFELSPVWSPDGQFIAFTTNRRGPPDFALYMRPASSIGDDELLVAAGAPTTSPTDWSPDGRTILYSLDFADGKRDIWAVPFSGERKPFPVLATPFNETSAQFSPDGQWIAYQSNEPGSVGDLRPALPRGSKVRISTEGGIQARWRRDGKELFYLAPDNRLDGGADPARCKKRHHRRRQGRYRSSRRTSQVSRETTAPDTTWCLLMVSGSSWIHSPRSRSRSASS